MKFDKKYAGKWVIVKNNKVIKSDKTLIKLTKKIGNRKDRNNLRFTLIPNGLIAGCI